LKNLKLNIDAPEVRETLFADIIVPIPIPNLFTYRVPFEMNSFISVGSRVVIPFGRRKILTGVVGKIHSTPPQNYEARPIMDLLDEFPSINSMQLRLLKWMADYYMCTIGEAVNVALPSGLKLNSESLVQLHPEFDANTSDYEFSDSERNILYSLSDEKSLSYDKLRDLTGIKNIHSLIKSLVQKDAVIIYENLKEKYKPKKLKKVRLVKHYVGSSEIENLCNQLEKKEKQLDVLLTYLKTTNLLEDFNKNGDGIPKARLTEVSHSAIQTLIGKGIFEEFEVIIPRLEKFTGPTSSFKLNKDQQNALEKILFGFEKQQVVLLHGITGSGKTEVFIELIKEALDNGSQVLYLLPEIALTTQIVSRLRKIFGDKMGVYHSKFSDNERVEVWKGIHEGKFAFVVGVRSSLFLPFSSLGLIIVDEEHELSYKQFDPAPRYNARDSALMLGQIHNCKVLLGSATPTVESYYNASEGKYGLVELKKRFTNTPLPDIELIDMIRQRKAKLMHGEFSDPLVSALSQTLNEKEQAIIFQNRRGYAPHVVCQECGWVPQCPNCSVSLTYHQYSKDLRCHYCGHKEIIPPACKACGASILNPVKFGTEKLEEELKLLFPNANVQRMDLDTTRTRKSYQNIIEDFEEGAIDILVGTQMVSKGLDFDKVILVGIFDIDRIIHFPDFRSFERAFQLATQVSGRAGRRDKKGKVIIQTNNPEHFLLKRIQHHDYAAMYSYELSERKKFNYPPFSRLIRITLKHSESKVCEDAALFMAEKLIASLGKRRVLGPAEPLIMRIRNKYLREIYIKLERGKINLSKAKEMISGIGTEVEKNKNFPKVSLVYDVDPY